MADQKLNRLKLLMKDRDFDWPSPDQLRANRLEKVRKASDVPSSSSSQIDTGNKDSSSSSSSLPLLGASNALVNPLSVSPTATSNDINPLSTMPNKLQTIQIGAQPLGKASTTTLSENVPFHRQVGEMATVDVSFCPIIAVSKYPYRFMRSHGPANQMLVDQVSQKLFAAGKFWQRQWTVYYIHPPSSVSSKPLLVVPASEVVTLLQEITDLTGKKANFPSGNDRGFLIHFPDDGSPRPRYLGVCTSRNSFDAMEAQVPPRDSQDNIPDRSFHAFETKIELAIQASKNKATAAKAKKKANRIDQKRGWCSQLRRTQRYLGLRPTREELDHSDQGVNFFASPEDQHAASMVYQAEITTKLSAINTDDFAPYPFEDSVVFICVDVECWEHSQKMVTEIGISTLDTKDIENLSPGTGAQYWISRMKSRHFRIKENQYLTNNEYVQGCPDRFEKAFGESEFITLEEAPKVLASCFQPPFGYYDVRNMPMGPLTQRERLNQGWGMDISDAQGIFLTNDPRKRPRKLVLVGHDVSQDISYLRSIGFDTSSLACLVETVDTAHLYQAWKQEEQLKSLGSVLAELGIAGWNLHNAGNDAAYTLQALLALSLAALNTFSPSEEKAAKREAQVEAAKKEAEERVRGGFEEWDTANKMGEVKPTLSEGLKHLKIAGGNRKSVISNDSNTTTESAAKLEDGKLTPSQALTSPTTVTSYETAREQSEVVIHAVEEPKPQSSRSRYKYNAKKHKNAGTTANNAVSKSLANLKANYANENPLPLSNPKPKKPKAKRSKKPKPVTRNQEPVVMGDSVVKPTFGTDRGNASDGVNTRLPDPDAGRKDASIVIDADRPKPEPDCWHNVATKPTTTPKSNVANTHGRAYESKLNDQHGSSSLRKAHNANWAAQPKTNGESSGPVEPQRNFPRSNRRRKRPAPPVGGTRREEYQHPPEIMRLPKHLRPLPPPGWRVPVRVLAEVPDIQPQFAGCEVEEDSDDDLAYGIIDIARLEGKKGKDVEKERKGWIGDRPATWWKEKTRREREEDGIFDLETDSGDETETDYSVPVDFNWDTPQLKGEGEDWRFMQSGPSSGPAIEAPTW